MLVTRACFMCWPPGGDRKKFFGFKKEITCISAQGHSGNDLPLYIMATDCSSSAIMKLQYAEMHLQLQCLWSLKTESLSVPLSLSVCLSVGLCMHNLILRPNHFLSSHLYMYPLSLSLCIYIYIYIYFIIYIYNEKKKYINRLLSLVGRVFANGPRDLGSIPGGVIPKTVKMILDTSLLNTQQYKVRVKGKVEQSRERSSGLHYTAV